MQKSQKIQALLGQLYVDSTSETVESQQWKEIRDFLAQPLSQDSPLFVISEIDWFDYS